MCLYLTENQSVDQLFKEGQHKRTFWKVVHSDGMSHFWDHQYKVGKNISTRTEKSLSHQEKSSDIVSYGIHVYTSKTDAKDYLAKLQYNITKTILPVICYKKDLVAIGLYNEAVFMNVYVEPRTYQRVFGKVNKDKD